MQATCDTFLDIRDFMLHSKSGEMLLSIPSFTLEVGTVTALIGKSGAGKTVFTCLLMGHPSFGVGGKCSLAKFSLFGHNLGSSAFTSRKALDAAMETVCRDGALMYMPQNFPLSRSSDTKVRHSMSIFLAALLRNGGCNVADAEHLLVEELSARGLASAVEKSLSKLSGGERRRVELATRLAAIRKCRKPTILLLDEPTTGFDLKSASDFMAEIRYCIRDAALASSVSVIIATHDLGCLDGDDGVRIADRVAVINKKENPAIATPLQRKWPIHVPWPQGKIPEQINEFRLLFCGHPDNLRKALDLPDSFSYAKDGSKIYECLASNSPLMANCAYNYGEICHAT